ncbi:MAG: HEPN domain-containing protein [Lentisphaeria bacterium]|nr:HEPN domain-containing protein [Lentisphaeria bacterium]
MSGGEAIPWLRQAESDLRVAEALRQTPAPMRPEDAGCHAAAMCAQTIEKAIKGYMVVNGSSPKMDHRPDKYLHTLLIRDSPLLRHREHYSHLSKLFDSGTRSNIEALFALTPGGHGKRTDAENTEYPWQVDGAWREVPAGSNVFADSRVVSWLRLAKKVKNVLHKLTIAAQQGAYY